MSLHIGAPNKVYATLFYYLYIAMEFLRHYKFCIFIFHTGSPVTRWASAAFGAGVGIGAAYTECSYKFGSPVPKPAVEVPDSPISSLEVLLV